MVVVFVLLGVASVAGYFVFAASTGTKESTTLKATETSPSSVVTVTTPVSSGSGTVTTPVVRANSGSGTVATTPVVVSIGTTPVPITHCNAVDGFSRAVIAETASKACGDNMTGTITTTCLANGTFSKPYDTSSCRYKNITCPVDGDFPETPANNFASVYCPFAPSSTRSRVRKCGATGVWGDVEDRCNGWLYAVDTAGTVYRRQQIAGKPWEDASLGGQLQDLGKFVFDDGSIGFLGTNKDGNIYTRGDDNLWKIQRSNVSAKSAKQLTSGLTIFVKTDRNVYTVGYHNPNPPEAVTSSCCVDFICVLDDGTIIGLAGTAAYSKTNKDSGWTRRANLDGLKSICQRSDGTLLGLGENGKDFYKYSGITGSYSRLSWGADDLTLVTILTPDR